MWNWAPSENVRQLFTGVTKVCNLDFPWVMVLNSQWKERCWEQNDFVLHTHCFTSVPEVCSHVHLKVENEKKQEWVLWFCSSANSYPDEWPRNLTCNSVFKIIFLCCHERYSLFWSPFFSLSTKKICISHLHAPNTMYPS